MATVQLHQKDGRGTGSEGDLVVRLLTTMCGVGRRRQQQLLSAERSAPVIGR